MADFSENNINGEESFEYEGSIYSSWEEYLDCLVEAEDLLNHRRRSTADVGSENGGSEEEIYEYDSGISHSNLEDDLVSLADSQRFLTHPEDDLVSLADSQRSLTFHREDDVVSLADSQRSLTFNREDDVVSLADSQRFLTFQPEEDLVSLADLQRSLDDTDTFTAGVDLESGGLSEEEISRHVKLITNTKNCGGDDDRICAVCQDNLYQTDAKIGVLECKHEYHYCCINKWLHEKNVCPVCKRVALSVGTVSHDI